MLYVESNPLFGAVMRPYIDSLREQTRTAAFFFSEMAGHQEGLTDSYWLAAQKYVDSLGVWATALSASGETSFNESFRMLWEAVPPQKYFRMVGELAHQMWRNAGRPYFRALDFWVSAENHILTIGGRSIAEAKTLSEAVGLLGRTFSDLAADAYLAGIRERAYYIWKALGELRGHALDDWLEAEAQALGLWRSRR